MTSEAIVTSRTPRVTVMVAVYNVAPFLRQCIDSILDQSFGDFEAIVVDDGSSDRSSEILDSYGDPRLRVMRQSNQGIAATRRRILSEARGDYVAVLDGDDANLPGRFRRQVAFLDAHPDVAAVGGQIVEIDEEGRTLCEVPRLPTDPNEVTANFIGALPNATCMYRRQLALDVGNYSPHFARCGDNELMSRMLARHCAVNLTEPVVLYRIRRGALTTLRDSIARRYFAYIRQQSKRLRSNPDYRPTEAEVTTIAEANRQFIAKPNAGLGPRTIEAHYLRRVGRAALRGRRWRLAGQCYWHSILEQPLQWLAYTGMLRAAIRVGGANPAVPEQEHAERE